MNEKPIPSRDYATVAPPNREYAFFEGGVALPFKHDATNYESVNASWLAHAALLAYDVDENYVQTKYNDAGLSTVQSFVGQSTRCYVASNNFFTIVSFRGTRIFKPGFSIPLRDIVSDVARDIRFTLVKSESGGYVHEGFQQALDEVWEARGLKAYLDAIKRNKPRQSLWFTGHSLGAALATLAVVRYRDVQGLYTIGSPLVGDASFARSVSLQNVFRIVNNNDFVARIPPRGKYKRAWIPPWIGTYEHVGAFKYIDAGGSILDAPGPLTLLEERLDGYRNAAEQVFSDFFQRGIMGIPNDEFVDHAPIFYATNLWNNCVG